VLLRRSLLKAAAAAKASKSAFPDDEIAVTLHAARLSRAILLLLRRQVPMRKKADRNYAHAFATFIEEYQFQRRSEVNACSLRAEHGKQGSRATRTSSLSSRVLLLTSLMAKLHAIKCDVGPL
jgi:hypothetical protein